MLELSFGKGNTATIFDSTNESTIAGVLWDSYQGCCLTLRRIGQARGWFSIIYWTNPNVNSAQI